VASRIRGVDVLVWHRRKGILRAATSQRASDVIERSPCISSARTRLGTRRGRFSALISRVGAATGVCYAGVRRRGWLLRGGVALPIRDAAAATPHL